VTGFAGRRLAIEVIVQLRVQDPLGQRLFRSSKSPSLENTSFGSCPKRSWSTVSFLITIVRLLRFYYGLAHKIPGSPTGDDDNLEMVCACRLRKQLNRGD
jgi:hypothetical protein